MHAACQGFFRQEMKQGAFLSDEYEQLRSLYDYLFIKHLSSGERRKIIS